MSNRPYLLWQDVMIEEEVDVMKDGFNNVTAEFSTWTATFEGSPHRDDDINPYREPTVKFERQGSTAMEAASRLENAANLQGWDIR